MKNDDRCKQIGRQLQRLRKDAGFKSAASFAKRIGIKTGTYTSYEQGEASFSYERAWDMADALHVSLDKLGGREWPPDGSPDLTADERSLVDNYRRADAEDRPALATMAAAAAVAGEAKNESKARPVGLAGGDVREG